VAARRQKLLALAVVVAWLGPRIAEACSCGAPAATLSWPAPDATGVPTDSPFVLLSSDGTSTMAHLRDGAGAEVAVEKLRVLDVSDGCGPLLNDIVLVRPQVPLAPNTAHTLELTFSASPGAAQSFRKAFTFTTGSAVRVVPRDPVLHPQLFAQDLPGHRYLQLFVEASGSEPSFVVAKGNPATVAWAMNLFPIAPPGSMPLGERACADFEHVDITGKTLLNGHLCEPQRCLADTALGCGTCGDNCGGHPYADWATAPACGSASANDAGPRDGGGTVADADAPEVTRADASGMVADSSADTGSANRADAPTRARSSGGCAVGGRGTIGGLWVALLALALRRRWPA
jgi:hypothetical protein